MTYPKMINWSYYAASTKDYIEMTFVKDEETENEIKKLGFIPKLFFGGVSIHNELTDIAVKQKVMERLEKITKSNIQN